MAEVPDGYFGGTVNGRPAIFNPNTGDIKYLDGGDGGPAPLPVQPPGNPPGGSAPPGEQPAGEDFVRTIFRRYVGREPTQLELDEWSIQTPATVEEQIRTSDEAAQYAAAHGITPPVVIVPWTPPPTVVPPAAQPSPHIGDSTNAVLLGIAQAIHDLAAGIGGIKSDIERRVAEAVSRAAPIIGKAYKDVSEQLGRAVDQLVPNTLTLIGSALGGVEQIAASFLANAADVTDVAGAFVAAVSGHKDGITGWIGEVISEQLAATTRRLAADITDAALVDDVLSIVRPIGASAIAAAMADITSRPREA